MRVHLALAEASASRLLLADARGPVSAFVTSRVGGVGLPGGSEALPGGSEASPQPLRERVTMTERMATLLARLR
jgi:hypothetical protein